EVVVTGRTVGTERDVHLAPSQLRHVSKPGRELQIGARTVHDVRSGAGQNRNFVRLKPHTVRENETGAGEPERVQVFDVFAPYELFDELDLFQILARVRVDEHLLARGQLSRLRKELLRARNHKPGGEGGANAVVLAPVPPVVELHRLSERLVRRLAERR